jgi:LacI family transcriptional regulator
MTKKAQKLATSSGNRKSTIISVAREAGVSTQTVSRVISNRPDVAPDTRERVQQVIARQGYQPNAIARSLVQRRSHTLGVVASGLEYFGPSRTLVGIEKMSHELGYSLLLSLLDTPETPQVERQLLGLLARQVDGIIWAVPEIGDNHDWMNGRISDLPVPVVFLSMEPRPDVAVVAVDNRAGGRVATEHLLAQGYRNIGHIAGPATWWEARERRCGWETALADAGQRIGREWVVEGNWSTASGEAGLRQLLAQYPPVEAVFAGNDQMALGVLQAAQRLGRRMPEDLAVVGFDDTPESAYFWPSLTTMRQELDELGGTAVDTLSRLIEARLGNGRDLAPSPSTLLSPRLVVRESSSAGSLRRQTPRA